MYILEFIIFLLIYLKNKVRFFCFVCRETLERERERKKQSICFLLFGNNWCNLYFDWFIFVFFNSLFKLFVSFNVVCFFVFFFALLLTVILYLNLRDMLIYLWKLKTIWKLRYENVQPGFSTNNNNNNNKKGKLLYYITFLLLLLLFFGNIYILIYK